MRKRGESKEERGERRERGEKRLTCRQVFFHNGRNISSLNLADGGKLLGGGNRQVRAQVAGVEL